MQHLGVSAGRGQKHLVTSRNEWQFEVWYVFTLSCWNFDPSGQFLSGCLRKACNSGEICKLRLSILHLSSIDPENEQTLAAAGLNSALIIAWIGSDARLPKHSHLYDHTGSMHLSLFYNKLNVQSVSRVKPKDDTKEKEQQELARAAFQEWLKRKCKEPRGPRASPSRLVYISLLRVQLVMELAKQFVSTHQEVFN